MLLCPDDLEPCRRATCGRGRCERTAEAPLIACWECGTLIAGHVVARYCVECVSRYTPAPAVEEGL